MYVTVCSNHYRKVTEQPRDFYAFNMLHITIQRGFFEDALSFKANSSTSLALRNVYFHCSILVSSSLKPTFLTICWYSKDEIVLNIDFICKKVPKFFRENSILYYIRQKLHQPVYVSWHQTTIFLEPLSSDDHHVHAHAHAHGHAQGHKAIT